MLRNEVLKIVYDAGYRAVLFDADDTLFDTNTLIAGQIDKYLDIVSRKSGIPKEICKEKFTIYNNQSLKKDPYNETDGI